MNAARSTTIQGDGWLGIAVNVGDIVIEVGPKRNANTPLDSADDRTWDAARLDQACLMKFHEKELP